MSGLRISRARIAIVALFALLGTGLAAIPAQAQTITTFIIDELDFGAQAVGTTSASHSVDIAPDTGSISVVSAEISGTDTADFAKASDTCSGTTVEAGGSCSVGVTFSPTATGSRRAFLVLTDAEENQHPVILTGTGVTVLGQPRAWGRNSSNQVGDETSTNRPSPTEVSSLSDVVNIAGGFFHSIAIANGGAVYTWGSDDSGQLGNGAGVQNASTPQVLGAPTGVSAVSAEGIQSLALDSAGQVWQWGSMAPSFASQSPQHVLVPSGCELAACVKVVAVSAGVNHALALNDTGHVYAWGSNQYGQLGDGTNTDHPGATLVPNLQDVMAISAGEFYSSALKSDGTVWSWGNNARAQLADCGTTDSNVPVEAQDDCIDPGTLTGVAAIDAGSEHTLALMQDGTVEVAGGAGIGAPKDEFDPVPGLTDVTQASGGAQSSFFLMADGTVNAWGDNRCGQLGIGIDHTCDSADTVATPTTLDGLRSVQAVSAGHFTNYAIVATGDITDVFLSVNRAFSPTGITEAPLDDVPAAHVPQQLGQTETAPIGRTPIGRTPIGRTPIGRTPIGRTGTGNLPIGRTPIGRTPIGRTAFAQLSTYALGRATLAEFPIYRAGGWPAILAQTENLKASTPQGTTFAQLWADPNVQNGSVSELDPSSPNALRLDEFNLALSPLGNVSLLALLLGNLTWDDIAYPTDPTPPASWCDEWTLVGRNCNGTPGTADTIFEADLSGFPLDQSTLALRTVGDIAPARLSQALFPSLTLFDVQIKGTRLADIELGQIPAATRGLVVDCSLLSSCSDLTLKLGEDPAYSAIKPSARFGDLGSALDPISFADLELAFIPRSALAWEDIPLSDIPFEKYTLGNGEPANLVTYTVQFDIGCNVVAGLHADVTLPQGFRYRPDSSEISDGESFDPLSDPNVQGRHLTWKPDPDEAFCTAVVGATRHLEISFQVMPGFDVGTFGSSASVAAKTIPPVEADSSEATVTVTDFEPFEGPSLRASADTLIVGQITGPNDIDNYDFSATPGQVEQVTLSHLSRDLDLVLYAPEGSQPQEPLRSTPPQEIPFGKAPLADPGVLGGVIPPEVVQDIHLAPGRPLAGISSLRGTDSESVSTTVVAGTGGSSEYRIQVTGYNGDFGPEPYVLLIRQFDPIEMPACEPRTFPHTGTPSSAPLPDVTASDNTLFIVDKQRLEMAFGGTDAGTVIADAQGLAAGTVPGVHGKVVFVDSVAAVQTAFNDSLNGLDADPCSPQRNDDVVRAINDVIDGMRADTSNDFSGIRSIVIVGDDDIIPHARLLDTTGDGNERGFAGDMFFTAGGSTLHSNQFTGAFGNGYFLSDAPYGAFVPLSLAGQIAYIPQVAVGRLPGDAGTIHRAFQAFTTSGGVANPNATSGTPTTAFVTHYDFFTDGGQRIVANLTKPGRLSPAHVTQLSGSWTREQFRNAFTTLSDAPDIVSPNAHYDQSRLLPGEGDASGNLSTVYTTQDLQADNPDLTLRVVFGIGCHAGLSLPDRLTGGVAADQARVDDWAQAYAGQGTAVLVGNLGYGFGDTATVGFSEQLMANFADDLLTTPSVGVGLIRAQQDYFTQMASFTPYDLKAIEQIVTWGFPMYRMPGAPAAAAASASTAAISQDPISGLQSTTIPVAPNFTRVTASDGSAFYQADAGTQTTHGYPIVPKFVTDIPAATGGLVAHGAAPISLATVGTPFDEPIHNTFGNATLDNSALEPAPASEVVYPTTLQNIGTFVGTNGSFRQQLVVTPGQFRSDTDLTNDPGIGTIRRFRGTWLVTYGPANTADFTGPDISIVEAIKLGGNTAFVVQTDDGSGVTRVFVQALMADGSYRRVELGSPGTLDGNGRWTGGMAGTPLEVFAFAFDGKGNSSSATQKGPGYIPSEAPPLPDGVSVKVDDLPPRNDWYTVADDPPLEVAVTPNDFELRVDGGPAQTGTTEVSGDGVHLVDIFAPDGSPKGSVVVAIDTSAPHIVLVTPPAGSPYGVNQQVTEDYQCIDTGSGIASCSDLTTETKLDTARPGLHTFTVTATDVAGNSHMDSVTYVVNPYNFFGFFQPIDNILVNVAKAGQTVPVKWRITDSNGVGVTDPGSFVAVTTTTSGVCGGTGDPIEEYAASSSGLQSLGGGNWQFNWKTSASFAGQCRTLQLRLFDGTTNGRVYATAQFRFK